MLLGPTTTIGMPDCPEGYSVVSGGPYPTNLPVVCERDDGSGDQVVRVGDFWIDRYEMSVWSDPDCDGTAYGVGSDDYGAVFPDNGNWTTERYACSVSGVQPATWITWFQAQQACSLSGKSLCSNAEWQAAASGTPDDTTCNVDHGTLEDTGANAGCVSNWGAMDMVANAGEWVDLWQSHPGWNGDWYNDWSTTYGDDIYWSGGPTATSMPAYGTPGSWRPYSPGFPGNGDDLKEPFGPAAARRGGHYGDGTDAGVFALRLSHGPSYWGDGLGARCCMGREEGVR